MSWEMVRLGDVCDTSSGGTPSSKNTNYYGGDIPWIKSGDLRENIINQASSFITEEGLKNSSAKWVEPKAVLLAMYGATVGRLAILNIAATTNQAVCSIRPKEDNIAIEYIYYLLRSKVSIFLRQAVGGAQPNISQTIIKETVIPFPPLPEQQRIADILDKAEAINQKREQALALCDEFLRATFLDMFGDPVSNPKGWEVERLESFILHMNNGLSRRRKVQENVGDIVLRLQDIQYDGIGFEKELNRVELDENEKKRYELLAGDILFVRVNGNPDYVGRSAVFNGYKEPIFHNDHLIRIRLNERLLPEYLVFLLHSDVENNLISQQIKTSAGQHTISQKGIKDIEIPISSVDLQQKFINILEKVNAIKAQIQQAQELPLFNALSQQAFKGELTQ